VRYASVVVGTDGSSTAEQAVRMAAELAGPSPLLVVTAFGGAPDEGGERVVAEELAARGRAVAEAAGAEDVESRAAAGAPPDVLLGLAAERAADLIVVGSLGMTGPSRFTLGGVANDVTHAAPCDVLVVHTAG
jgi:nucleotide-binding universal stress UspA family protein